MRLALAGRWAWVKGSQWRRSAEAGGPRRGPLWGGGGHRLHKRSSPLTRWGPAAGHAVPYLGPEGHQRWGDLAAGGQCRGSTRFSLSQRS